MLYAVFCMLWSFIRVEDQVCVSSSEDRKSLWSLRFCRRVLARDASFTIRSKTPGARFRPGGHVTASLYSRFAAERQQMGCT